MRNPFSRNIKEYHAVKKQFNYSKGDVQLKFTLRVDISSELKTFKELLEKAIEDISEELNKQ